MSPLTWKLPKCTLTLGPWPLIMGIVNVTPDSFSDGGKHFGVEAAIAHGLRLVEQGAHLLDVGGESSRPGAEPVSTEEELRRVLPVIKGLASRTTVPLSVDTYKANVARACLEAGGAIVNDITALNGDPEMADVVSAYKAGLVLMHMQGTPATMQDNPAYDDVVAEIGRFFEERLNHMDGQGINQEQVVLDVGIGFGKRKSHNVELLDRLKEFLRFNRPLLLGVSRKGFLTKLSGTDNPQQRLAGSLAVACHVALTGTAHIIRVHDVEETHAAYKVLEAIGHVKT
jgi:dihydropteroate synthase